MRPEKGERPGVIFYFSDWLPLLKLDDQVLSELFRACIRYAHEGTQPDFSGTEEILWGMLIGKIDRDGERYEARSLSGEYGAFCREAKKSGNEPIPFEAWREMRHRSISDDNEIHRSIPVDIEFNHSQIHPHLQKQGQSHSQQQRQGDPKGGADMPEVYRPPSEAEFERLREERIAMLCEERAPRN